MYVYVTRRGGGSLRNQIVRIRARGDVGRGLTTIVSTPASSSPYHNGGRIVFGPDGKLLRDRRATATTRATPRIRTANLRGKILRMNPDGSAPRSNPMIGRRRTRVFAYGIRNSFGFTFDPAHRHGCGRPRTGLSATTRSTSCAGAATTPGDRARACPDTNQDGPGPAPPAQGHLLEHDRHHRRSVLRRVRPRPDARRRPVLRRVLRRRALQRIALNARAQRRRRGTRSRCSEHPVATRWRAAPNGRIFFSDTHAIYRLVRRLGTSSQGGGSRTAGRARRLDAASREHGVRSGSADGHRDSRSASSRSNPRRCRYPARSSPAAAPVPAACGTRGRAGAGRPLGRLTAWATVPRPGSGSPSRTPRRTVIAWRTWALTGGRDGSALLLRPVARKARTWRPREVVAGVVPHALRRTRRPIPRAPAGSTARTPSTSSGGRGAPPCWGGWRCGGE